MNNRLLNASCRGDLDYIKEIVTSKKVDINCHDI